MAEVHMLHRLENLRDVSSGFPPKKPSSCCDAWVRRFAHLSREEENRYINDSRALWSIHQFQFVLTVMFKLCQWTVHHYFPSFFRYTSNLIGKLARLLTARQWVMLSHLQKTCQFLAWWHGMFRVFEVRGISKTCILEVQVFFLPDNDSVKHRWGLN